MSIKESKINKKDKTKEISHFLVFGGEQKRIGEEEEEEERRRRAKRYGIL